MSKHLFSKAMYHVGPVDNCSAISPTTQNLSLEHLGIITAMTNSETNHMSCIFSLGKCICFNVNEKVCKHMHKNYSNYVIMLEP